MASKQTNFGMSNSPGLQARNVRSNNQTIKPWRSKVELRIGWQGIRTMKYPAIVVLNRNPAVPFGMSEERHEVHFGGERKANSFKSQPLRIGLFVKDPGWIMNEVCLIVCQFDQGARMSHCFKLPPMNMHLCMRKIWNAASVVKVQVCQDDMLDTLGRIAKMGNLTNSGIFGIIMRVGQVN